MNIAVVTGASSGLGTEFVKAIADMYPALDEIWIMARRKEKLEEISKRILTVNCRTIVCDVTNARDINMYQDMLKEFSANVKLLVNNAGFGKLGNFYEIPSEHSMNMIRLNCEALTVITAATLEYMKPLSQIINVSSIASFVPNARMAVYSSTKAYVTSFSRALREELKSQKINVTAVCPGPMETEFLSLANIEPGSSRTFDTLPRVNPQIVAQKSLIAAANGKGVYTPHGFYKFYRILSKIIPHSVLMKLAKT